MELWANWDGAISGLQAEQRLNWHCLEAARTKLSRMLSGKLIIRLS